jgi:hypothetical protein
MRKQLVVLFSAAALALVVSCAGSDDASKVPSKIEMPAPIHVAPGVYTVALEKDQAGRETYGLWKDGEPCPFTDDGGKCPFTDEDGNPFPVIIDFRATPGYIYVLAYTVAYTEGDKDILRESFWINGQRVAIDLEDTCVLKAGTNYIERANLDHIYGLFADGDEWYLSGKNLTITPNANNAERQDHLEEAVLWTKAGKQTLRNDEPVRKHDNMSKSASAASPFAADGSVYVAGSTGSGTSSASFPTLWVDGVPRYLCVEGLRGSVFGKIYSHTDYTKANAVFASNGNIYVAGTLAGNSYVRTESGEIDYFVMESYALLWENDAPPKVLKGTNGRYSEARSIFCGGRRRVCLRPRTRVFAHD